MSFANKVVIVTGASSGIGAVTALHFVREGANVTIVGRNEQKLKDVAQHCEKAGSKPLVIRADLSKDDETNSIIQKTVDKFGRLDILINSAGFSKTGTILDGTIVEAYDDIMKTNVRAVINLIVLAAPHLIKTKGNIVNVSSVVSMALTLPPNFNAYSVSKAALDHFTRGSALELSAFGVRVNSVNPGPVVTDFMKNAGISNDVASYDSWKDLTLLKRTSQPEEIADLILFLASDKARGITGSLYIADNGAHLKN